MNPPNSSDEIVETTAFNKSSIEEEPSLSGIAAAEASCARETSRQEVESRMTIVQKADAFIRNFLNVIYDGLVYKNN